MQIKWDNKGAAALTKAVPHTTRTLCWPRYYIIDFGYSRRYDPNELPSDVILAASDRSAPELNRLHADPSARLNPFSFDEFHPPLQFLLPLVNDMTQDEPSLRPTISEAVARFARLCNSLTTSQLRASPRGGSAGFSHRCRRLMYTVTGVPPLPAREFSEPVTVIDSCLRSFYTLTPGHVGVMDLVLNRVRDYPSRTLLHIISALLMGSIRMIEVAWYTRVNHLGQVTAYTVTIYP
ncbi:uncharacterized protein BT62DRAFT_999533 [Guyanagaster necrorhizus]|uniref:Uncharacterized protein n=1 Tax=Guyanagaster necrorhizus TaxID=856835 RepID=A0A9P7W1X8_9AGAR|nr:uncharacterized protein BT62DRAFT_999533 [Guyanagaster necrorhizus MCA 3950]KAG7451831.1 hypothetical protein BT62DRAFT_999533 [Guyanagaster necrorhizus MCA 3950]